MTKREFKMAYTKSNEFEIKFILLFTVLVNCSMVVVDYFTTGVNFKWFFISRMLINNVLTLTIVLLMNTKFVKERLITFVFAIYSITIISTALLLIFESSRLYFIGLFLMMLIGIGLLYIVYRSVFIINVVMFIIFSIIEFYQMACRNMLNYIIVITLMFGYVVTAFLISKKLHDNVIRLMNKTENLKTDKNRLFKDLSKYALEYDNLRESTVYSLAIVAESHDGFTGEHLKRVGILSKKIAENISEEYYSAEKIDKTSFPHQLELASILHDIGKVAIPTKILKKKGPLTAKEREAMQIHSQKGFEILSGISTLTSEEKMLYLASKIALCHHENWDGSGYPNGLAGDKIPLAARIVSIADVYDALTQDRPYRKAFSKEKAIEIMKEEEKVKYDSKIFKIFLKHI